MKKIYLSLLAIALFYSANAQLSLTKAFNEPVIGNVNTQKGYDSTSVIPKSTGTGQNWNFSTLVSNTVVSVSTFTTVASTPSASSFPGATLAEADGAGGYNYWKSTATNYELLGNLNPGSMVTFSNSGIVAIWPITFGYNNTDAYAGTVTSGTMTGPANGTLNTVASGSGTITLPGSVTFTNTLQLKVINNLKMTLGTGFTAVTINIAATDYNYYVSSQKFEVLNVSYQKQTITSILGPTVTVTAGVKINNAVVLGINEVTFDKAFNVYPNPANGKVNVMFANEKNENLSLEIMNSIGQNVKSIELGNSNDINTTIDVSNLNAGVYYVKTSLGNKSVVKKLIIQ